MSQCLPSIFCGFSCINSEGHRALDLMSFKSRARVNTYGEEKRERFSGKTKVDWRRRTVRQGNRRQTFIHENKNRTTICIVPFPHCSEKSIRRARLVRISHGRAYGSCRLWSCDRSPEIDRDCQENNYASEDYHMANNVLSKYADSGDTWVEIGIVLTLFVA